MPWKNGGGVAHDIIAEPRDAGYDSFAWRLSAAEVTRAGPFSLFPEIDRSMAILSGEGLVLEGVPGRPMALTPRTEPFAFPGDVPVTASLLGGPVFNMNLMTRRTHHAQAMNRLVLTGTVMLEPVPVCLIHLEEGAASVTDAGGNHLLQSGDTALCTHHATVVGQGARLLVMHVMARS